MTRLFALLIALALMAVPGAAQVGRLEVPSGQLVLPYEALWEDHINEDGARETWLIIRFLAPQIARDKGQITFGDAEQDIAFLCSEIGVKLAAMTGGGVDQVVVTLMDQPLPRGMRDTGVTKFMSAYRIDDGVCIWN